MPFMSGHNGLTLTCLIAVCEIQDPWTVVSKVSWWTLCIPSLVILVSAVLVLSCRQTDTHTEIQMPLITLLPSMTVIGTSSGSWFIWRWRRIGRHKSTSFSCPPLPPVPRPVRSLSSWRMLGSEAIHILLLGNNGLSLEIAGFCIYISDFSITFQYSWRRDM